jgi:hypothetical protein
MKCTNCRSCMKIYRLDEEEQSYLYFYCSLCGLVHNQNKKLVLDNELSGKIKKLHKDKYGKKVM